MRLFPNMIPVGARTVYFPVKSCLACFLRQYAFRQWTPTDIPQANHQNSHVRKDSVVAAIIVCIRPRYAC